jgi:hypothetical protein
MPQMKALAIAGGLTAVVVAVVVATGAQLGAFGLDGREDAERAARQEAASVAGVSEAAPIETSTTVPQAVETVLPGEESALALAGVAGADQPVLYVDDDDDDWDDDDWDDDDRDEHRERAVGRGSETERRGREYDVRQDGGRSNRAAGLSLRRSEREHDDDD